jgi:hypothetical protein
LFQGLAANLILPFDTGCIFTAHGGQAEPKQKRRIANVYRHFATLAKQMQMQ